MKKLSIFLALLIAAIGANAQVVFKNGIKPNTTYTTNREMNMVMNMAPPEAMAAAGQTMTMNMVFNTTSILTTSPKNSAGEIPLMFTSKVGANKMTLNGQEMPANMVSSKDAEMTSYGRFDGNKITVDSIPGKMMNDSVRKMMDQIIENARSISKFPDHPLKVGDTFTSDAPFALPLPGMQQQSPMDVKSNYKLVSLNGNVGVFELTTSLSVNMDQSVQGQSLGVNITGMGTGTITFDARKEYYTGMDMKMTLDFGINTGGMEIKGKGNLSVNDKVDIASK
jgi:hypothetical protein